MEEYGGTHMLLLQCVLDCTSHRVASECTKMLAGCFFQIGKVMHKMQALDLVISLE